MQKFRVTKKEFLRHFPSQTSLAKFMNDEFILEGELLEGGTVECECVKLGGNIPNVCTHFCHNKKEEITLCKHSNHLKQCPKCFNRETPKENISGACQSFVHETCAYKGCVCNCHIKEEVKLPEKLNDKLKQSVIVNEWMFDKINEILTYLASKGDKLL